MMLQSNEIIRGVADTLVRASTSFSPDQKKAYHEAILHETDPKAVWALRAILDNAEKAEELRFPFCDDTGIPHAFLEIGDDAVTPPGLLRLIDEGIAEGLRCLPGRPMGVIGNDLERITQEKGLSDRSEDVLPAPVQIRRLPGNRIRLTILMLGGGPEIRGLTQRVFHKHNLDTVRQEMIRRATEGAKLLGCQPCVLGFGVGRTQVEAASYALEAYKDANFDVQSDLEREITEAVNECGTGPLGLHGKTTVLRTFIKIGPQRASGIRVVALRVGCCFDPRRASLEWETV